MVKHTETIVSRLPTNCLSMFVHFMRLVLKASIKRIYSFNPWILAMFSMLRLAQLKFYLFNILWFLSSLRIVRGWPREERPSGLRRSDQNRKVPVQTQLGALLGLGVQPRYDAPGDHPAQYVKRKWVTSGEWGCLLDNGPMLAVGQPNSS